MRRRLVEEKGADPARVHVIHNWADCEAIVPGPKDNAFSREHGLADRFVLMHSGNVGLSQNLDVLVEAADRLRSKERLTVVIVGDGSKRQALEAIAVGARHDQRAVPAVSTEGAAARFVRRGRCVSRVAEGRHRRLHRAEQGLRHPRSGPAVHRRHRSEQRAGADSRARAAAVWWQRRAIAAALADAIATMYDDPAMTRDMGARARLAARQYDRKVAVQAYHDLFARVAGAERAA